MRCRADGPGGEFSSGRGRGDAASVRCGGGVAVSGRTSSSIEPGDVGGARHLALSALLCPLLVWPLASPFVVTGTEMINLLLFGTTQFGLGLVLLTVGGQLISATENALLNTLETPLAVAWVWVCFGETPSITSFVGGIIVMLAVFAQARHGSRSKLAAATP